MSAMGIGEIPEPEIVEGDSEPFLLDCTRELIFRLAALRMMVLEEVLEVELLSSGFDFGGSCAGFTYRKLSVPCCLGTICGSSTRSKRSA
jgi:hypothetical protein